MYREPIGPADLISRKKKRKEKPQDIQGSRLLAIHQNEVKIVFYVQLPLSPWKKIAAKFIAKAEIYFK